MPAVKTRDEWTHDKATDAPKTTADIMRSLKYWLGRYAELPEDARARPTLTPGYKDRIGAQDIIATRADLTRLLGDLPERQREAVIRCLVGGQSKRRAAVAMQVSPVRANELVGKGLWRMAKALQRKDRDR